MNHTVYLPDNEQYAFSFLFVHFSFIFLLNQIGKTY